jgi:hypothetical protein
VITVSRAAAGLFAGLLLAAPAVTVNRTVQDARIDEASGLVASPGHPGVLWTHNDSGNPPLLFALRPDGSTAATVRISGVADVDWEAIAAFRDRSGGAVLAIGDIGDNAARRHDVQVVLLPEPPLHQATVRPSRVLRLRYPDGPADAETLLVDTVAQRMYVVTKGFGSTVYQVPERVWPGGSGDPADDGTLVRIATVPLLLVTDGVIGVGGHPVLRTYSELAVLPAITASVTGGSLEPLAVAKLPQQPQGEGLAIADGGSVLLASEGVRQPILRMHLPNDIRAALATPGESAAVPSSTPTASRSDDARSDGSGRGATPTPSGVPALAITVVASALVVVGAVVLRRRRR